MAAIVGRSQVKEASIEITVIRANGDIEHHGVVSYYHRNPLRRWAWSLRRALRGRPT